MKLNEILKPMFERAGANLTEPSIKAIMDNPAFAAIDVNEDESKKLLQEMLTIEAAKQNPELTKHFKATVLSGVDAELNAAVLAHGLSDEDKKALTAEQSSYKRIAILVDKVKAAEAKKVGATQGDKDTLTKEIEKLNGQINTVREQFATEKTQILSSFDSERLGWKLDSIYNTFVPKMEPKIAHKVNMVVAKTTISEALQKDGLKVVDKDGKISLLTSTDTEYFDATNKKVGFEDYVNKVLANEKLLVASNSTSTQSSKIQQSQPAQSQGTGLNFGKFEDALTDEFKV